MRIRSSFTPDQLIELENCYESMRYVKICNRSKLATKLNLNEKQVRFWFQNRRAKERRANGKLSESVKILPKIHSPLSPSQSLSSSSNAASSPSSPQSSLFQAQSIPLEDWICQTNDYQSIAKKSQMQYKYIPEWEPQKHTTSMSPDQYVINDDNMRPIKMEPIAEEQTILVPDYTDVVNEYAENYGFVAMQDENDGPKTRFTATEFEEYKKEYQQNSPFGQQNLNSNVSIGPRLSLNDSNCLYPTERQFGGFVDKFGRKFSSWS